MYAKLLSALSVVSQKKMLGRIEAEWDLTEPFLMALTTCQANITQFVSEADKREKVTLGIFHTFDDDVCPLNSCSLALLLVDP